MTDFLDGDVKIDQIIRQTPVKGLAVILSGQAENFSVERVTSVKMKEVYAKAKASHFDVILFDLGDLGNAQSIIAASATEEAIFVVAKNKTTRHNAQKAKESLAQMNVPLLGVVVNFDE